MPDSPDPIKDFNAIELSVQAHGEGIISLGSKVTALEETLKDPKLLAKILEEAAEESTRLQKLFSKIFCDMMKKDDAVKTSITEKMDEIDRAFWKRFRGQAGLAAWSIFLIVLTAVLTAVAEHHLSGK